jgi:hypothetical protein
MDSWVASLRSLSEYGATKQTPVYFTAEQEFEVKLNQGTFAFGARPPTIPEYVAGMNRFLAKVRDGAPLVKRGYWYGYSDTAKIAQIGAGLDPALLDWISLDPYRWDHSSPTQTFVGTIKPKLDWLRAQAWYRGQPIGLSEFGSSTDHGDAATATWMTDLRAHMGELGLGWGILFNRIAADNFKLDTGAFPLSVRAFSASLAAP